MPAGECINSFSKQFIQGREFVKKKYMGKINALSLDSYIVSIYKVMALKTSLKTEVCQ